MSAKPPVKMQLYLIKTGLELCCNRAAAPCEAVFSPRGLASTTLPLHTLPPLFNLFFYSLKTSNQLYTTLLCISLCFYLNSTSITSLGHLYPSGPFCWSCLPAFLIGFWLARVLMFSFHTTFLDITALVKLW